MIACLLCDVRSHARPGTRMEGGRDGSSTIEHRTRLQDIRGGLGQPVIKWHK
jgi:hypothetical protein